MSRASNQAGEATAVEEKKDLSIKKMSDLAWMVLEIKCTNPKLTQVEIAEAAGCTTPYVCRIVNSKCFQDEMSKIRQARIMKKLEEAGEAGVDRLQRIVESDDSANRDAIDATELMMKGIGIISQGGNGSGVNVQIGAVTPEGLGVTSDMVREAAARRREKVINEKEAIDGEVSE